MPGMTKVHPNVNAAAATPTPNITVKTTTPTSLTKDQVVLTVWKKSLLLNCSGFTVFDSKGDLVFRVDNYAAGNKGEIVLMDSAGKPLLTIRHKRLSFGDNWQVFDGETTIHPRFTARKAVNLRQSKSLAQVSRGQGGSSDGSVSPSSRKGCAKNLAYEMEGSYAQRSCAVYDDRRHPVAEIKPKDAVGNDVFRLVVQPELDMTVAMALVILLDQMFGSSRRF